MTTQSADSNQTGTHETAKPASTAQKRGLGRGLSALIPQAATASGATVAGAIPRPAGMEVKSAPADSGSGFGGALRMIALSAISLNPNQPRKTFGRPELDELTASIKEHGVLQPIVVRVKSTSEGGGYELIAGERRFRASSAAGLSEIPAVVRQDVGERESLALALIENIQREDLNVIESAQAYEELLHTFNMTQSELAQAIGKSQPQIANALRMLNLPEPVRESLRDGNISEGHAKVILSVGDEDGMTKLWSEIVGNCLTVRQAEQRAPYFRSRRPASGSEARAAAARMSAPPDPQLAEISQKLSVSIGTRVRLLPGRGQRGVIEISYYDHEHLESILERINTLP